MAKKSGRKPNAKFMAPVTPDATLAAVVGAAPLPRTEMTKKLWVYIKKNGLQDKKNRRMINADAALKAVFGGKSQVSMFDMTKLVSKHVS
jgi:chromatin remodeling complex protein RSC6